MSGPTGATSQTPLSVSFVDAAKRHWKDAELLYNHDRAQNADHLYGLAAECSLKAVLRALGALQLADQGRPKPGHLKVHVDTLWDQFRALADGLYGSRYGAHLREHNPFTDWEVSDRYAAEGAADESVERHRRAACSALVMLLEMELDGLRAGGGG